LFAIKEKRSFSSKQKNVLEQNTAEGVSLNGVLRKPSRRQAAKQLPFVKRSWAFSF